AERRSASGDRRVSGDDAGLARQRRTRDAAARQPEALLKLRTSSNVLLPFAFCLLPFTVAPAFAQQRPLVTEDPETIGAGRILVEAGIDYAHDQHYPVSGLNGNLWRLPTIGLSFGLSSIAELQYDGGLYDRLDITS